MAKNKYIRPVLLDITPEEPPTIDFGGSQGTEGDINQFTFSGIEQDTLNYILENADYTILAEIDSYGTEDLVITLEEYNAWLEDNPWF